MIPDLDSVRRKRLAGRVPAADDVLTGMQLLRERGVRPTAARLAVLQAAQELPHATADDLAAAARERLGALSTAAVYDVLNALTAAGVLRRIEPAGSPARYETRVADNHHHLVCRSCGAVADVDCAVGSAPCLAPSDTRGFVLDEAEVTWWGSCAACSADAESASSGIPLSRTSN